jgi:hypothetical protein
MLFEVFVCLVVLTLHWSLQFACIYWRHAAELMAAGRNVYTELRIICVWVKHNAGMGSFHHIEEAEVAKLQWQPKSNPPISRLGLTGVNLLRLHS